MAGDERVTIASGTAAMFQSTPTNFMAGDTPFSAISHSRRPRFQSTPTNFMAGDIIARAS